MNIIIVDDDKLVCQALKTILEADEEISVPATGGNADEAVELYRKYKPDVILMDIRMGEKTGIDAGKRIVSENPAAKILFLTTFADNEYIIEALKLGAKGYLLKQNFESIIPSVKAVQCGQNVYGEEIVAKLSMASGEDKRESFLEKYGITDRERDIIEKVADGLSNREIAEELFLGEGTVRNYLSVILEKVNLRDRTQLAVFYYKNRG